MAIGHSAGGQLAFWAAARRPAGGGARADASIRLAGAVAQAGVLDLREAARLRLSSGVARRFLGGSPGKLPERYDIASPIERLPLGSRSCSCTASADEVVPIAIARRYAERAAEAGDPCELATLPGVGHMEHLDPGSEAWRAVTDWLARR